MNFIGRVSEVATVKSCFLVIESVLTSFGLGGNILMDAVGHIFSCR